VKRITGLAAFLLAYPTAALAAPGLGEEVYGTHIEKGEIELEARYDRLAGGADNGEDVIKLEAGYGVSDRFKVAILSEFEKEPGNGRKAEEIGVEAIYRLGSAGPIDFALYGEYAIGLNGNPDGIEGKLLMQHREGPWDMRLNLTAAKALGTGEPVEFSYAASADVAATESLRLGIEAFGDLGNGDKLFPYAEHFVGPTAKLRIAPGDHDDDEEGFTIQAGYLFAVGKAREDTDGQLRLALEFEF